jgi:hypothetical protein
MRGNASFRLPENTGRKYCKEQEQGPNFRSGRGKSGGK